MSEMKEPWARDAVFYHIYPLGALGAPARNDLTRPNNGSLPEGGCRLDRLHGWIDHIAGMGFTALYLGPVFESTSHGYDTIDYFRVDRRLGDNAALRRLVDACHGRGIKVVLDAVLNHVGREFPGFREVREKGVAAQSAAWFAGLDFNQPGPAGDSFSYEGWHGHYDLVKLDTGNPGARGHLLDAVRFWMDEFAIDGLRLDAADCLAHDFLRELHRVCAAKNPDFWLMGEVVHGDYNNWANPASLDSTTNYEAYKGLWSSLNDANYFEIDWTLKRQFGPEGMYRQLWLYNFVDNHDVDRIASVLKDSRQLEILYAMLFTMPGIPAVYYGSEWGLAGKRDPHSDAPLRPALDIGAMVATERRGGSPQPGLCAMIAQLIRVRQTSASLRQGAYTPVHVAAQQMAFWRGLENKLDHSAQTAPVLVVFNAADKACHFRLDLADADLEGRQLTEILGQGREVRIVGGHLELEVSAFGVAMLKLC